MSVTVIYGVCVIVGLAGWAWAAATKKAPAVVLLFLATLLGWLLAAMNAIPNPTLAAFIVYMATMESLGPTSSMILQIIKSFMPSLEEKAALAASFIGAAVLCLVARLAMPYTTDVPIVVDQIFVLLVWAIQQVWYLYAPRGTILTKSY